jgi:glutamine synthetase
MRDIWQLLTRSGVPVDSMQVELGAGMFEFPIKESDPLSAADRAVIGKMAIKEICYHHGLLASFMAKIHADLEGLSGAVHHSLIDPDGRNLFYDPHGHERLSQTFDHWAEGILQNLQDMTLLLLPNFNSYKRPLPGCFVGNSTTWSVEGRGNYPANHQLRSQCHPDRKPPPRSGRQSLPRFGSPYCRRSLRAGSSAVPEATLRWGRSGF